MQQSKKIMDIPNMFWSTAHAKRRVKAIIDLAEKVKSDKYKKSRLDAQNCKACFYTERIGGAAMTSRECMSCGQDQMYGSTSTDVLCMGCAKEHELCKHCGGDISLRERRREWPEPKIMPTPSV